MLYCVEVLHHADVLHGDIKPDNWLLMKGDCESLLRMSSSPEQDSEYLSGDIRLIDFGRAIDKTFYAPGTVFCGDCHTKGFQCIEMLENRPWTNQIDSFGLLSSIHCMLFGDYMDVKERQDQYGNKCWTIIRQFKRYWQVELWSELFDSFLNISNCELQPSLGMFRRRFESYFLQDPSHMQVFIILIESTKCNSVHI
jgi:checkpoint serine/threonine-protein kinase